MLMVEYIYEYVEFLYLVVVVTDIYLLDVVVRWATIKKSLDWTKTK